MSDKERGIYLSRRQLLQLPVARGAGNLETLANGAKVVEFAAKYPDKALVASQRFISSVKSIFQLTFKPDASEIFKDRPEEVELPIRDRAINAVTDLLQPHVDSLREWELEPTAAIEPLADYLTRAGESSIFRGAVVLAGPHPVRTFYAVYQLISSPQVSFNDLVTVAQAKKSGQPLNSPGLDYARQQANLFDIFHYSHAGNSLSQKGPFLVTSLINEGITIEAAVKKIDRNQMTYLGALLPI